MFPMQTFYTTKFPNQKGPRAPSQNAEKILAVCNQPKFFQQISQIVKSGHTKINATSILYAEHYEE